MLDEAGNIIGLSVAGFVDREGSSLSGLNLFVPVAGALEALDITYEPRKWSSPLDIESGKAHVSSGQKKQGMGKL